MREIKERKLKIKEIKKNKGGKRKEKE